MGPRHPRQECARLSEELAHALLQSASEGILACDPEGKIMLANPAAERMFGFAAGQLSGRKLESLVPQPMRKRHRQYRAGWFADPRNRPMGHGFELAGARADGSTFPIEVSLSSIRSGEATFGVAFVSDITERRHSERTLLEYSNRLRDLTGTLLTAQETANRRVARELHDGFSQDLAATIMEISLLKSKVNGNSEAVRRLGALGKRIKRLSADVQRTARELHPGILEELGLVPALRQECESFQQNTGIPTRFELAEVPANIPPAVALCLYRVTQESLRNVHKHSESPRVKVRLGGDESGVTLRVEDAGDGFELDRALRNGGLGLISMQERVRLVNGRLTVQSWPGAGTTVTVSVPLPKESS